MAYYQVFSGTYNGEVELANIHDVTSYQAAVAIMKEEWAKPGVKEVVIYKDENPIEYMNCNGRIKL